MYIITILYGRNCQALLSAFFAFFYLYPYGQKLMQPRARNISAAPPSRSAVYLHPVAQYRRLTSQLAQEQKGLDERARMASQWPSLPW